MKLYAVIAPNGQQAWASSKESAGRVADMLAKSKFGKREDMEFAEHDVPGTRTALVSWLCIHARLNSAKGTPGDTTAPVTQEAADGAA